MKGTLKGAALGAALAAVATLLLAPKTGKKTRQELSRLLDAAAVDLQKKTKKMQKISKEQYEGLFLNTLAQAAKKKEEAAELFSDVSAVLKKGWDDMKKELKSVERIEKTPKAKK